MGSAGWAGGRDGFLRALSGASSAPLSYTPRRCSVLLLGRERDRETERQRGREIQQLQQLWLGILVSPPLACASTAAGDTWSPPVGVRCVAKSGGCASGSHCATPTALVFVLFSPFSPLRPKRSHCPLSSGPAFCVYVCVCVCMCVCDLSVLSSFFHSSFRFSLFTALFAPFSFLLSPFSFSPSTPPPPRLPAPCARRCRASCRSSC